MCFIFEIANSFAAIASVLVLLLFVRSFALVFVHISFALNASAAPLHLSNRDFKRVGGSASHVDKIENG